MKKNLTGYASIDRPWMKYYPNITDEQINTIYKSMFQMLDELTSDIENEVTIEYFGNSITNKEYKRRILECAKSFYQIGVRSGDIVPLILPNQPESRILIYALNVIGAIAYPIQPTLSSRQLSEIIYENNVKNIAIYRGFYRQYKVQIEQLENIIYTTGKESLPKVIQDVDYMSHMTPQGVMPYNRFILEHKSYNGIIKPVYQKDSVAAIIGTSGTTGIPKGVCLTNENLNAMALQHLLGDMNFERGDILLNILIDSIGYGLGTMHYSGCCGLKSILIPKLTTNVAPLFLKYHPNHFTGGPIHAETLEKYLRECNEEEVRRLKKILYKEVKNWVSGGAPLKKTTEKFLNEEQILVRQGLGCTENGGAATYAKKGTYKENGVGIPLMLEVMSIFEKDTDKELPYGVEGEICITGPTVMKEYLNNPEETNKTIKIHKDGKRWIHTGDKGYIDEDGQVYITGRFKNMIHRLGFNIHPSVITEQLSKSNVPGILDIYVTSIPHHLEQNVPVAFISIDGSYNINKIKREIKEYAESNLSKFDIPYDYVFVLDPLPRNIGGKIDILKLKELANLSYEEGNDKPKYLVLEIEQKQKKMKR